VDSHLGPYVRIQKARRADIVWCAQKPFVELLRRHGVKATWLPLACEPQVHCTAAELAARENREPTGPDVDLAFVGHIQNPKESNRLEFLDGLFKAVPNSWYAYGHFHEDMSRVYHRARLGVNHAVRNDLNMRFFELASMGVPQLADARMVGLEELGFENLLHYEGYDGPQDAAEVARMALMPVNRDRVLAAAARAKALVRASHTYYHRLCTILADVETFLQSTRSSRVQGTP